ncbi:PQQ-binding-like beta-propeller repeat protein [Halobacteria archaeon AArc-dxtr1]|nr:PQQ-binding-like beta-propeller repeat protein [Halobacteria archaeon AArc-dxtr1]
MNRRTALTSVTASALGALAGCLSDAEALLSDSLGDSWDGTASVPDDESPETQFQYGARNAGVAPGSVPDSATTDWETRLSPVDGGLAVGDERIVVAAGGTLFAVDRADGAELWDADIGHDIAAPPALDGEAAYVTAWNGTGDRGIAALSLADGSEHWRAVSDVDISSAPTLAGETVYVGGSINSSQVIALDAADGSERWRFEVGENAPTPAVADGTVFAAGGSESAVYALDAADGDAIWEYETDDRAWTPPAVVEETVYATSRSGRVYALDASDGDERWSTRVGSDVRVPLAASPEGVYVPTADSLVALDKTGEKQWSVDRHGLGALSVADDGLVAAGDAIYCFDLADGSQRWRYALPDRTDLSDGVYAGTRSSPVIVDGTVYAASFGGDVVALSEED